jgi:GST-like protein
MIDLYGMASPNVLKIAIMLEELELPYRYHLVDVLTGDNRDPAFLAMNPLGKVPVIVDRTRPGLEQAIFESGAILIYLAETYGSDLLPVPGPARWEVLKWLMVQLSLAGPMLGQLNHFQLVSAESNSYAGNRYRDQAANVYRVFDTRLGEVPWLGGASYSIADIAMYPWAGYLARHGFSSLEHPHLVSWRDKLDERPAVKRAVATFTAGAEKATEALRAAGTEDYDRFFNRSAPGGPVVDMDSYLALGAFISAKPA